MRPTAATWISLHPQYSGPRIRPFPDFGEVLSSPSPPETAPSLGLSREMSLMRVR